MAMLVKEILEIGKRTLESAGIFDAKVDAEALFCYMMNINKTQFFMMWSKVLEDRQCDLYFELIDKRASRVPLQHIIGVQNFMGLEFDVSEKVLIPRMDTEVLVETVIAERAKFKGKINLLDLCCGSGVIGISLDKLCKGVKVTCSDISEDAIALTNKNAKKLGAGITVKKGSLFEPFRGKLRNTKFDIIVSNPPYIESAVIQTLDEEVRDHEPMLALDGGIDGLDFYRIIFEEIDKHLEKKGMLIMEIGHNQGEALIALAKKSGGFSEIEVKKDFAGLDRVIICRR